MEQIRRFLLLVASILFLMVPAFAQFAGGDGRVADPWQIETINELQLITDDTRYLNAHFIQIADIDASETVGWNDGEGFRPIGDKDHPFEGSYDGNGHQIYGLAINREEEDNTGLFGVISSTVKNLILDSVKVTGRNETGGLTGSVTNSGMVENVHVSGIIKGYENVGGLAGVSHGQVVNCSADIVVHGNDNDNSYLSGIGGLVGSGRGIGIIEDSFSKGEVNGINNVGGLIGQVEVARIINSYSEASLTGENHTGGLIGLADDYSHYDKKTFQSENHIEDGVDFTWGIIDSYAIGNVTGKLYVGGLAGYVNGSYIQRSYATGEVTGDDCVGGLIGSLSMSRVYESFAAGAVTGSRMLGGLAGCQGAGGFIIKSFASGDVTGVSRMGGLVGNIYLGEIVARGKYTFRPVSESFATGKISHQGDEHGRGLFSRVGVFLSISGGVGDYSVEFSFPYTYWDMEGTGVDIYGSHAYEPYAHDDRWNISGPRGLTTDQMTGQNAFIHMYKLDFENTWQLTNEGYPVHRWLEVADTVAPPEVPLIDDLPENHDFGSVAPDSMITQLFTIHNIGLAPLEGEASLSGAGFGGFELLSGGGAFNLHPGELQDVEVRFQPDRQDSFETALQVIHNGANLDDTLKVILEGTGKTETSAGPPKNDRPVAFELHQNYPNPFNPETVIWFELPETAYVHLQIFDALGRRSATLIDETKPAGTHQTTWNASGMASGVYLIRMVVTPEKGKQRIFNQSMTLVK